MSKLLKPSEAAARLGVTLATLERWRCGRSGPRLPFIKLGDHGAVRYREADVDAALALQVDALIEMLDQRLVELVHDREMLAAQREAEGTP